MAVSVCVCVKVCVFAECMLTVRVLMFRLHNPEYAHEGNDLLEEKLSLHKLMGQIGLDSNYVEIAAPLTILAHLLKTLRSLGTVIAQFLLTNVFTNVFTKCLKRSCHEDALVAPLSFWFLLLLLVCSCLESNANLTIYQRPPLRPEIICKSLEHTTRKDRLKGTQAHCSATLDKRATE